MRCVFGAALLLLQIHIISVESRATCLDLIYMDGDFWTEPTIKDFESSDGCYLGFVYDDDGTVLSMMTGGIEENEELFDGYGKCTEETSGNRHKFFCFCNTGPSCALDITSFEDYLREKIESVESGGVNYYKFVWDNLYGGIGTMCSLKNTDMNDTIRLRVLAKHNALRTDLALGVVLNGQTDTYLRKANKMFQLRYSCNLETTAIERAKQCSAISNGNPPNDVSENFRKYTQNINRDRASAATMTTQLWWSEITKRETSIDQIQNLYYDHLGISSFAKIASDLTTDVGCAVIKCEEEAVLNVVCHYKTTLTNAQKLYSTGPTCKKCPDGIETCVNGLCPAEETYAV